MKLKTFKQLNAERAARRARPSKKIKLKKLMHKLKDEDPDAWLRRQASSSQAGGPSHKESGSKHALEKPQIIFRTILEFEKDE